MPLTTGHHRWCAKTACAVAVALAAIYLRAGETLPGDFFKEKVTPILQRCVGCHGKDDPSGELDLSERATALKGGEHGAAFAAGKAAQSLLYKQVADGVMPPKKQAPLTKEQIEVLRRWIDGGAQWDGRIEAVAAAEKPVAARAGANWWALQPVARPAVPAVENAKWTTNSIDSFVLAELEKKNLRPAPAAERAVLLRRVRFDLTGLPPTLEELDAFVKDDSPQAYEKVIDALLASPQYGERWGRHWLDTVRFCESDGFEHDKYRERAWPYRDYVIRSFNADLPYAQFVREQIAGDVLERPTRESIAATGFLTCGPWDMVGQTQASKLMRARVREDDLEDVVSAVSQTFLGMTVNCARCHNHKFDPIPQTDYYRIKAVFEGVRHGERPAVPAEEVAAHDKAMADANRNLAEFDKRVAEIEQSALAAIASQRKIAGAEMTAGLPQPIARWRFANNANEEISGAPGVLNGNATLADGCLKLVGNGAFLRSAPLNREIKEKTLEAWVRLANLTQRGGSVLTLETPDGRAFDAIVFGEREVKKWMAGSEFFARSKNLDAEAEDAAQGQVVHVAVVYSADNRVAVYRNGVKYGAEYAPAAPLQTYPANDAHVLIGQRHTGVTNGQFNGEVDEARVYDRALSAEQIALSFKAGPRTATREEIRGALSAERRAEFDRLESERAQARAAHDTIKPVEMVYAASTQTPEPTHVLERGDPEKRGVLVSAGALSAVKMPSAEFGIAPDAPESARRRAFAEWVVDAQNPLTARVLVNRVWQYHFGRGIVGSPNDFGFNGERPTHPELLDWLASEFIASGGRIKALHRVICLSSAYRQSSRFDAGAAAVDSENRLLWHGPTRRLEAEAVRDAMLAASGTLSANMGGPGFRSLNAKDASRRSVYYVNTMAAKNPLLETLDCPDPSVKTPRRLTTTTPLQALSLMNNPFVWEQAKRFAERVMKAEGGEKEQVALAWRLALSRGASKEELDAGVLLVKKNGLSHLCWVLFNSTEFLYVN